MQKAVGQLFDLFGHGGAEQQGLAAARQLGDHFFYIVYKAHVKHTVGFVQHKDLNAGKINQALADQIVQAARTGNENIHAAAQCLHLRLLAYTAEDHGVAQL